MRRDDTDYTAWETEQRYGREQPDPVGPRPYPHLCGECAHEPCDCEFIPLNEWAELRRRSSGRRDDYRTFIN